MPNVSFRKKQNKAGLQKQKVTVVSAAVATTKFLLYTCVDNESTIARVSEHGLNINEKFNQIYM